MFSLMWSTCMQIYRNERKRLHKERVQLPQHWFGTPTWPPFHCFGTPIWPLLRHVKKTLLPATADLFPLVANTGAKSVQKQIKSIDVDKVGSKRPLASKSCFM